MSPTWRTASYRQCGIGGTRTCVALKSFRTYTMPYKPVATNGLPRTTAMNVMLCHFLSMPQLPWVEIHVIEACKEKTGSTEI